MAAAITFDFDPTVSPFGLPVRLETLALCGVIFLTLILIALRAGRVKFSDEAAAGTRGSGGRLRRDDLILIAFGVVPGAVVGGRLGYGLLHLDYYSANPMALTDPGQGGLGLTLAVLFGTATGLAVARLLAAPIDRWLGVAGVPILLGLGLGKLTMVLGGTGQGSYSGASWATSYPGDGPWGSMRPDFPALPAQAVEGGLVLLAVLAVVTAPLLLRLRVRRWGRIVRPGRSPWREWSLLTGSQGFATIICLWISARFFAVFTWRDAAVLGPFRAEHIVLLIALAVAVAAPGLEPSMRRFQQARASRRAARAATKTAVVSGG